MKRVDRGRLRWPVALVAAVVVAEAAVFLFRPRSGVIDPAPVSVRSYFSEAELDRARDFRLPQLALYGAGLAVEAGLLAWLVTRPPRRLEAALHGPHRRPLLAAAAAGAALSVGLSLATLPIGAISRQRALDVGLSTQSWGGWALDRVRGEAIGAAMGAVGGLVLVALMRRFPRLWWAPASAGVVIAGAALIYAGPIVLDPIFNRFTPLERGQTRADVLELAREAGVDVGEVYEVDASKRTTAANAYVAGLGHTKRVVLYDTLLENFSRDEIRLVVAHELGHQHYDDLRNGLIYLAIVAPFGMFAVQRLSQAIGPKGLPKATAAVLPAVALSVGIVQFALTTVSNQLSRRVEARADTYSLRLTDAPEPFISFERRIAVRNISMPDPPALQGFLLGTHPPTIERIGAGVAFSRSATGGRGAVPGRPSRTPGGS